MLFLVEVGNSKSTGLEVREPRASPLPFMGIRFFIRKVRGRRDRKQVVIVW